MSAPTQRSTDGDAGAVADRIEAAVPPVGVTGELARNRMRAALLGDAVVDEPTVVPSSSRYAILDRLGEGGMGTVWAAWDRTLDRKVALKLVRPELVVDPAAAHRRILREAQALARVQDPRVVAVFDVATWSAPDAPEREYVLLAMEHVAGETLATWLAKKRTLHEIVAMFVDAARGLAAAHRAGVVHGDFKPANVIVDTQGHAKVVDFGLARIVAQPPSQDTGETNATAASLAQGRIAGTPLYMAPEQHEGREIDARADQYSLCVALWEATTRAPAFAGTTLAELLEAKRAFDPRRAAHELPGWLHRVLARGLAYAPADRHRSIDELIGALERGIAPRWRVPVALATIGGAIGLLMVARDGDACTGGDQQIAALWSPTRAAEIGAAFGDAGVAYAATTWQTAAQSIDAWSIAWREGWRAACESHRGGGLSDTLLDKRMACLDRRLAHLSAAIDAFATPSAETIENAVQIASRLPRVDPCADLDALERSRSLADDPERRAELDVLGRRIAAARVELDAGRHAAAAEAAAEIEATLRADAEMDPALVAEALLVRADAIGWLGDATAARNAWRDAALLAARAGDDDAFVRASAGLVWELANTTNELAQSRTWADIGEATLARAGELPQAEYLLRNATGTLALAERDFDRARDDLDAALALVHATWGERDVRGLVVLGNLGNVEVAAERPNEAVARLGAAVELGEQILGAGHPRVAASRYNYAVALVQTKRSSDSVIELERELEAQREIYGERHPQLGWTYATLAMAETNLDRAADARRHAELALELLGDDPSAGYVRVVARLARARALVAQGEVELASSEAQRGTAELRNVPHGPADEKEAQNILDEIAAAKAR
jgi:hypothetical protein